MEQKTGSVHGFDLLTFGFLCFDYLQDIDALSLSLWYRMSICAQVCALKLKSFAWYDDIDECVDWLMMRKQLRRTQLSHLEGWFCFSKWCLLKYSTLNGLCSYVQCTNVQKLYMVLVHSPPKPKFFRLVQSSIWSDTVRIENRFVTWLLHKSIHFVYPIPMEFVPFHLDWNRIFPFDGFAGNWPNRKRVNVDIKINYLDW